MWLPSLVFTCKSDGHPIIHAPGHDLYPIRPADGIKRISFRCGVHVTGTS